MRLKDFADCEISSLKMSKITTRSHGLINPLNPVQTLVYVERQKEKGVLKHVRETRNH